MTVRVLIALYTFRLKLVSWERLWPLTLAAYLSTHTLLKKLSTFCNSRDLLFWLSLIWNILSRPNGSTGKRKKKWANLIWPHSVGSSIQFQIGEQGRRNLASTWTVPNTFTPVKLLMSWLVYSLHHRRRKLLSTGRGWGERLLGPPSWGTGCLSPLCKIFENVWSLAAIWCNIHGQLVRKITEFFGYFYRWNR